MITRGLGVSSNYHKVSSNERLTNRWSQSLTVAMRTFDFMKRFSGFATLAAVSGGSAQSR
jgi:hypothetical protein